MTVNFIGVIVPLSVLLPIIIALIKWRQLTAEAKCLFWYLLITAVIGFAAVIMGKFYHKNNMPLVHLLTAIEMIIFIFYYRMLPSAPKNNLFYGLLGIAFVTFCIINAFYIQGIHSYSSYTRSVEAIICMLFALNYFAGLAADTTAARPLSSPNFYFNTGIFLYFSGAFMLFIFSNFIIVNLTKANFLIIWNIHGVLLLLMYLFFSAAFLLCKK